jgi:hydrogenase maturation protein HypF
VNCPRTTSAGRLFDAAAALLGLASRTSFEAQAPMALEAAVESEGEPIVLPLNQLGMIWQSDWAPLLDALLDPSITVGKRAAKFHATLAEAILDQARAVRETSGVSQLGLTGGVFQNRVLCERVMHLARKDGFAVFVPERIPCNDAGLSFGQLVEVGAS